MTVRKSTTVNPFTGDLQLITTGLSADKIADGSVSDAEFQRLNGITGDIQTQLDAKVDDTEKGVANGVATLDAFGRVPSSQLPSAVFEYKGAWDASLNSPTLIDGTGNTGDVYRVTVAGTQNLGSGSVTYAVGDLLLYDGAIYQRSDSTDNITSVFGRQGAVVSANGDYTASQVTNVASGNLVAVTVQAALNELQTDVDSRATQADFIEHVGETSAHGVSGQIVGTASTQTLSFKTIVRPVFDDYVDFNEELAPGTPPAGQVRAYAKSDSKIYVKTSAGVEAALVRVGDGGSGDVVGPASSVDSEIALFSGTTGKIIKRASGTGYVKTSSGVFQTPVDAVPSTDVTLRTNATVPGVGRLGEYQVILTGTASTSVGTTAVNIAGAAADVPAGNWLLVCEALADITVSAGTGATGAFAQLVLLATDGITILQTASGPFANASIGYNFGRMILFHPVYLNATTTFRLRGRYVINSGAPTVNMCNFLALTNEPIIMRAYRILG